MSVLDNGVARPASAANTDGEVQVDFLNGLVDNGAFDPTMQSTGPQLRRTAAATVDDWWVPIPHPNRTAASRGFAPTRIEANYEVDTADLEDVLFELYAVTMAADGSARSRAIIAGADDADYDADHDTPAKRGDDTAAPELHRIVMTVGTPAFVAADEQLWLRVIVDGDAGAAGIFDLTAVSMAYNQALVDAA